MLQILYTYHCFKRYGTTHPKNNRSINKKNYYIEEIRNSSDDLTYLPRLVAQANDPKVWYFFYQSYQVGSRRKRENRGDIRGKRPGESETREREERTGSRDRQSVNLTWIYGLGERIIVVGTVELEKGEKERDGGNYFRFRTLGIGYTFSLVSASARSSSPLPSSSAMVSLSLRDSSAGQGRTFDDPGLAASSQSIDFLGDFQSDRFHFVSLIQL